MEPLDDEKLLERLRAKFGPAKKVDERAELERIFGKSEPAPEERLRQKLTKPVANMGDTADIFIEKLAYGGEGLGHYQNIPVFVPDMLPGDTGRVEFVHVNKDMIRGKLLELIAPTSNRIPPRCRHFGVCGGCQLQHLTYPAQLQAKREMVKDTLKHIGNIEFQVWNPIASPETYGYRIRTKLQVGTNASGVQIGFYARRTNEIVSVDECPLLAPLLNKTVRVLREILPSPIIAPVPSEIHLHTDFEESQLVIHFVSDKPLLYINDILELLILRQIPVNGISNHAKTDRSVSGNPVIEHLIGGNRYQVHGSSFFQVNRYLLKPFLDQTIMLSSPTAHDILLDLYCGCGFLSIPLSRFISDTVGFDSDSLAIDAAIKNLELNRLSSAQFLSADEKQFFKSKHIDQKHFNMIVVDPPRSGIAPQCLQSIISHKPAKLLYISCNPTTLARDLKTLLESDFKLRVIQPMDMFPHTYHIETFAFLTHRYTGTQAATDAFVNLH